MKITLVLTGKTHQKCISEGLEDYEQRIKKYIKFDVVVLPEIKNTKSINVTQYKEKEAEFQKKIFSSGDFVVLLDENGKEYSSQEFSDFIAKRQHEGVKNLVFMIGGAYGFSQEIKQMAHSTISLSRMTFPHQLVRLIFMEQLYRAFTILHNEKYHH